MYNFLVFLLHQATEVGICASRYRKAFHSNFLSIVCNEVIELTASHFKALLCSVYNLAINIEVNV